MRELIDKVQIGEDWLRIMIVMGNLCRIFEVEPQQDDKTLVLEIPVQFKRRGVEIKLVLGSDPHPRTKPDQVLIRLISQAYGWMEELKQGSVRSNRDLAASHNVDPGDVARVLPLAFLSPQIVEAILEGRQPVELTAVMLKRLSDLPIPWEEQHRLLGFD